MTGDSAPQISDSELGHLRRAIALGEAAHARGNRPFGAVVISAGGDVLAVAENSTVTDGDFVAHAEINALRAVCRTRGQDALIDAAVYTNFPPCSMCAGAMMRFGVAKIVYGADWAVMARGIPSQSVGFAVDLVGLTQCAERPLHVIGPCLQDEAAAILTVTTNGASAVQTT
jgi:tRNA(adenine34) deaminase